MFGHQKEMVIISHQSAEDNITDRIIQIISFYKMSLMHTTITSRHVSFVHTTGILIIFISENKLPFSAKKMC